MISNLKNSSLFLSFLITVCQFYNYALFGLAAGFLAENFMTNALTNDSLLNYFCIFSATVIAKPLGAIFFGRIGDSYGRSEAVKKTLLVSAFGMLLAGLMPNISQIGQIASVGIILSRMLVLAASSSEIDAMRILIIEKAGIHSENFASGLISSFSQVGVLIAAILFHYLASNHLLANVWRLSFLAGGAFGLGLYICRKNFIEDSQNYVNPSKDKKPQVSTQSIITKHPSKFLNALLIRGSLGGIYHFLIIFLNVFLVNKLHIIPFSESTNTLCNFILYYLISCSMAGLIADKWQRPYTQINLSLGISIFLMIYLIITAQHFSNITTQILCLLLPFYSVPLQIIIKSYFPPPIRLRAFSISHSLGSMLLSSTAPFICFTFWRFSGNLIMIYYYPLILMTLIWLAFLLPRN